MTRSEPRTRKIPSGTAMSRRTLLGGMSAALLTSRPAMAQRVADLRGSIDADQLGVRPGAPDDQSAQMQAAIDAAAERGRALFLPGGRYAVSNLRLRPGTRLVGLPGQTRFDYQGGGHLLFAENARSVGMEGIRFDGGNRALGEYTPGLLHFTDTSDLDISGCTIQGSSKSGLALDRCQGRITGNTLSGARQAGLRSIEARGLAILDNTVTDCGNAGILVYRWNAGEDGTIVSGNRIERIQAIDGGTGQNGNGINVFRASGVIVRGNRITDCAFSAIRSNSGSRLVVSGNSCLRSGETAIYSEFAFQGAVIADNLVDGGTMGISIANFLDGGRLATCSGNIVRNIVNEGPYPAEVQGFGIGIAVEADTAVTGNVIENVARIGLHMGWGRYLRDVNATANVIRDCPTGIAVTVVEEAGPALVANNIISGAGAGAIVGYRWTEAVTGDLTAPGTDIPAHLRLSGNLVT
jgi:uncharacterized secreted repeat protein (TIGR03808 family)